jgi:signal transduction histidine kinase
LECIFEAFNSLDQSTTRIADGIGFGLGMAGAGLAFVGGSVWVFDTTHTRVIRICDY